MFDGIPIQLKAETFSVIRQLDGLPLDIKEKYANPKRPARGYVGLQNPESPLFESFGTEDASNYDSLKSFMVLMWPNGQDHFRYVRLMRVFLKYLLFFHVHELTLKVN